MPTCAGGNPSSWSSLTPSTLFLALHSQSGSMSFLLYPSFLYFCLHYLHLHAARIPPSQSIIVASMNFLESILCICCWSWNPAAGLGTLLLGWSGWFLTPLFRHLQQSAEKSPRFPLWSTSVSYMTSFSQTSCFQIFCPTVRPHVQISNI